MSNPVYEKVGELLRDHQEALLFLRGFHVLCHAIDDIVDEKRCDVEFISEVFILAAATYSSPFYRQYAEQLYPIVCHITNSFADSTILLNSAVAWQKGFGDAIRNCANDMVCCVINLCVGWKAMREVSLLLREDSYYKHHDENHNPI